MNEGTVKFFNEAKGFGFITPVIEGAKDVFFHISEVAGKEILPDGEPVYYDMGSSPKGPVAKNVRRI